MPGRKYEAEYKKRDAQYTRASVVMVMAFIGGFQLEFVSISRVINHMTCYKLECSHWWKIYFTDKIQANRPQKTLCQVENMRLSIRKEMPSILEPLW